MQRRKFLTAVGSLAAGGAAVMGTGAFTSVEADRSVTVKTAADRGALLQITKATENETTTPNADEYVDFHAGNVQIDVPNANTDATTVIRKLLDIRNEGSQPVVITHEQGFAPQAVDFFHDNKPPYTSDSVRQAGDEVAGWPSSSSEPGITNLAYTDWGNYAYIGAGETLKYLGMIIGLGTEDGEIGNESITINAKTPQDYAAQDGAPSL